MSQALFGLLDEGNLRLGVQSQARTSVIALATGTTTNRFIARDDRPNNTEYDTIQLASVAFTPDATVTGVANGGTINIVRYNSAGASQGTVGTLVLATGTAYTLGVDVPIPLSSLIYNPGDRLAMSYVQGSSGLALPDGLWSVELTPQ